MMHFILNERISTISLQTAALALSPRRDCFRTQNNTQ